MQSRRGVFYDLEDSIYTVSASGLIFYFSSRLHQKKFSEGLKFFIEKESKKLKYYYNVDVSFDTFLAVSFYKRIETRGFRIIFDSPNGARFEYKKDIKFLASII